MKDEKRIERLISLAERLIVALEKDIAALKQGRPRSLCINDPEIQKLTLIYGQEAQTFDRRLAENAEASLRQRFVASTAKFRELLQLHARMIIRVKNASEGMVRAIAAEVERLNAPSRTYGPRPDAQRRGGAAMLFNKVV